MVFLSGVLIPVATMPNFFQIIAYLLPLTYAVDLLQQAMTGQITAQLLIVDTVALVVFSVFFLLATVWVLRRTLH
jgi:ABC-type multidrug transport system permease subunit